MVSRYRYTTDHVRPARNRGTRLRCDNCGEVSTDFATQLPITGNDLAARAEKFEKMHQNCKANTGITHKS